MVGGTDRAALTEQQSVSNKSLDKLVFGVFLRLLSLAILVVAVFLWSIVLGVHGEDIAQIFDRDPFEAYLLVILCVLTPTISIGLWLGMSWGIILWAIVGGGLLICHFFFVPLSLMFYSFASALCVLLSFYCIALFIRYLFERKKLDY